MKHTNFMSILFSIKYELFKYNQLIKAYKYYNSYFVLIFHITSISLWTWFAIGKFHIFHIIHTSSSTWYTFIWEYLIFYISYLLHIKMLHKLQNCHFYVLLNFYLFNFITTSCLIWELSISHMSYHTLCEYEIFY